MSLPTLYLEKFNAEVYQLQRSPPGEEHGFVGPHFHDKTGKD